MAVYPRSRGEQRTYAVQPYPVHGLSPLARGTGGVNWFRMNINRFIPARAGNSTTNLATCRRRSVYPRSRGEQPRAAMQITLDDGLSPLARGTENTFLKLAAFLRFIPARAGNRDLQKRLTASHPVYPRSRGEQRTFTPTGRSSNGLSPLARGTVMDALEQATPMRFIPARAGNRLEGALASGKLTVYPRSRGEQWYRDGPASRAAGLSPLARGTAV